MISPDSLPSLPVMSTIEEAIAAKPRLAAYLLTVLFFLIVIPSWISVCVNNMKFRKQFAKEYRIKPISAEEFARQNSA